jgi:hypothetical protein
MKEADGLVLEGRDIAVKISEDKFEPRGGR